MEAYKEADEDTDSTVISMNEDDHFMEMFSFRASAYESDESIDSDDDSKDDDDQSMDLLKNKIESFYI
jgi:hypothetical protein